MYYGKIVTAVRENTTTNGEWKRIVTEALAQADIAYDVLSDQLRHAWRFHVVVTQFMGADHFYMLRRNGWTQDHNQIGDQVMDWTTTKDPSGDVYCYVRTPHAGTYSGNGFYLESFQSDWNLDDGDLEESINRQFAKWYVDKMAEMYEMVVGK